VLEGCGRDVVTFVDDDQSVAGGQFGDVVATSKGLQHRDIDHATGLAAAAAELACPDAEELTDRSPPLLRQRLAIHQNQRRGCLLGGDGTGDHGLPRSRRRHEYPNLVTRQDPPGHLLAIVQGGAAAEVLSGAIGALVSDVQPAAEFLDEHPKRVQQSTRRHEAAVEGLVVAAQEPWHVPR
jgi:hypothetical protein